MKKITAVLIMLLLAVLCAAATADDVDIKASFPDTVFQEYVHTKFDKDGNWVLDRDEINDATGIDVEEMGIKDLTGVEKLTALTALNCAKNELTALDLSSNVDLTFLSCYYNQIKTLDLSHNRSLTDMQAYHNQLTSVNVSGCSAIRYFDVTANQLETLDVTSLLSAEYMYCSQNRLPALDVSKCAKLKVLMVNNNEIKDLVLSNNLALISLGCGTNRLTKLDLSANSELLSLVCPSNQITRLDLSKNPILCKLLKETEPENFGDSIAWGNKNNTLEVGLWLDASVEITTDEGVYTPPGDRVPVSGIELNKTKLTLTRSSKVKKPEFQLKATVSPANATNKTLEWKSSNTKVVRVDQTGKVTARNPGKAVITCTAKDGSGVKATCKVVVKNKLVTKITLNKTKATMEVGKTLQLKVKKIKPADALNKSVTWKSSNRKVATVSSKGKVKAVGRGKCVITCTAKDGSKVKATCRITVK